MRQYIFKSASVLAGAIALTACSEQLFDNPAGEIDGNLPITLAGQIVQESVTRANDDGFADGDVMGVYIVDYEGENPGVLKSSGNRGDNVRHTFNEADYKWSSAYDVYWKDKHTRIDVYGYYPAASPEDVNAYPFTVLSDQSKTYSDGTMGNYEASDFLWGKVAGVEPTTNIIRLPMKHRMANARVILEQGSGFAEGEWQSVKKQVLVTNTIQEATIDLATGNVTPSGSISPNAIVPSNNGNEWRAIVVPQSIASGTTMFSITIDGLPYKFSKNEEFSYVSGKMNNFTIRVDKKSPQGDYALTLIGESITAWENDLVSHDATSKEYIVVDVETPGTLDQCIIAAGKDINTIQNLKITGNINSRDFAIMKYKLAKLRALNLRDVKIVRGESGSLEGISSSTYYENEEDEIPANALQEKKTLTNLVLPNKLKSIGDEAFCDCHYITGSLILPEGLESIGKASFRSCRSLTGSLSLPSTLKNIGYAKGYTGYWDGTFGDCGFVCELVLPEGLTEIGMGAFRACKGLYGELRLPEKLTLITTFTMGETIFLASE